MKPIFLSIFLFISFNFFFVRSQTCGAFADTSTSLSGPTLMSPTADLNDIIAFAFATPLDGVTRTLSGFSFDYSWSGMQSSITFQTYISNGTFTAPDNVPTTSLGSVGPLSSTTGTVALNITVSYSLAPSSTYWLVFGVPDNSQLTNWAIDGTSKEANQLAAGLIPGGTLCESSPLATPSWNCASTTATAVGSVSGCAPSTSTGGGKSNSERNSPFKLDWII